MTFHTNQRIKAQKHLSRTFSSDLKWTHHINEVETKANNKLNLLKKLKFKLDRQSLESIFMSFLRPTLAYPDYIWAGTYEIDQSKLDSVQLMQCRLYQELMHIQISTIFIKNLVGQV